MQATRTTPINRGKMLSLGDRFVPHIVPRDDFSCEERWSEWQDLNLRPPRPERGGARMSGGATETPINIVTPWDFVAGTFNEDPMTAAKAPSTF